MVEELNPQESTQAPAGVETPQPGAEKLGAEAIPQEPGVTEAPKPARTYTQDEWSKREAEKDKESAFLRQGLGEVAMRATIAEAAQAEREARLKDTASVEQGLITREEAVSRGQSRQRDIQLYLASLQVGQEKESLARERVAKIVAQKYGVEADKLLDDREIRTPTDMVEKASSLAQKKYTARIEAMEAELRSLKEGEPQFDRGQLGTTGAMFDKMSAEEKIGWALKHPQRKK